MYHNNGYAMVWTILASVLGRRDQPVSSTETCSSWKKGYSNLMLEFSFCNIYSFLHGKASSISFQMKCYPSMHMSKDLRVGLEHGGSFKE
jgi:hypothetical protein